MKDEALNMMYAQVGNHILPGALLSRAKYLPSHGSSWQLGLIVSLRRIVAGGLDGVCASARIGNGFDTRHPALSFLLEIGQRFAYHRRIEGLKSLSETVGENPSMRGNHS
jgi:hypothetical protein